MTAGRTAALAAIMVVLVVAGWRTWGQMQAERLAETAPQRALTWRPHATQPLQLLAERQLAAGDIAGAQASARELLAQEPLHGPAYRLLAQVAEKNGDPDVAALYAIAARRAPRDAAARAWLAQHHLTGGEFAAALEQIDRLLRLSPRRAASVHPALVQLAQDPGFAAALADALRRDPPWRAGVLAALRHPKTGNPTAAGNVMQALQKQGGLSAAEYAGWLDSLMAQDRWGEAYARWAAGVDKPGGVLPAVYNGDFERPILEMGFGWRLRRVPGVLVAFEAATGALGKAARFEFLGRRVPAAGLEQALMLSPGRYRLSWRQRADGLRTAVGLQWQLSCVGKGGVVGRSEAIDGTFPWRDATVEMTIPEAGCPGQWLRLVNPVAGGGAQQVAGTLWVDDVKIAALR